MTKERKRIPLTPEQNRTAVGGHMANMEAKGLKKVPFWLPNNDDAKAEMKDLARRLRKRFKIKLPRD